MQAKHAGGNLYQLGPTRSESISQKQNADQYFARGLDLEMEGKTEEAIASYEKALELDSESAGALVNLGTISFNKGRWEKAHWYYSKALGIDPEYSLAHYNIANVYDELGDRESAEKHYRIALENFPNYADVHYNLALLLQAAGREIEALSHWLSYLKLDPNSSFSAVARKESGRLRKCVMVSRLDIPVARDSGQEKETACQLELEF